MTLQQVMDQWADKLAKKAAQDATPLQESTDAFKAVTAYYAVKQKLAKKNGDDDDDPSEFSFAHGINEAPNGSGSTKVRARRNS